MPAFRVIHADITTHPSDLLLLKYAQDFFGSDLLVAQLLTQARICTDERIKPPPGEAVVISTKAVIAPRLAMFLGTVSLHDFLYEEMGEFAKRAIAVIHEESLPVRRLTSVVHGVGYGLDASEALQHLVRGFEDGVREFPVPVQEIAFVERNERLARVLTQALEEIAKETDPGTDKGSRDVLDSQGHLGPERTSGAALADESVSAKEHVFVAMPFSDDFQDVYEFGIYEPTRRCGYICERTDETSFTGDILKRIQDRIRSAKFVIAELTGARPNVYLEVGFAWGLGVPVILLARKGETLHFDVQTHRCIWYKNIVQLSKDLEKLLRSL